MISQILAAVLNFSDLNDNFCLACDEAGMVKILIKISEELQDSVSNHVKYMVGKQYSYTCHFLALHHNTDRVMCYRARVVQYSQIDSIGVSGEKKGLHWYQWYDWYQ